VVLLKADSQAHLDDEIEMPFAVVRVTPHLAQVWLYLMADIAARQIDPLPLGLRLQRMVFDGGPVQAYDAVIGEHTSLTIGNLEPGDHHYSLAMFLEALEAEASVLVASETEGTLSSFDDEGPPTAALALDAIAGLAPLELGQVRTHVTEDRVWFTLAIPQEDGGGMIETWALERPVVERFAQEG
jgi:hypothetical protein